MTIPLGMVQLPLPSPEGRMLGHIIYIVAFARESPLAHILSYVRKPRHSYRTGSTCMYRPGVARLLLL